jgi:predicted esterase
MALVALGLVAACRSGSSQGAAPAPAVIEAEAKRPSGVDAEVVDATVDAPLASVDAGHVDIGPFERPFAKGRNVYFVAAKSRARPARLLANLHGVCNPPGYACGFWTNAASDRGFLVCPEGNARCGAASYNAPTWTESEAAMDADLEQAIATVMSERPGEIGREGAILTGFSRGAYAAATIAVMHPNRWPYLILTEANVPLDARTLTRAGVKAVALVAGEWGTQIAGERKTTAALQAQGFRAKLWAMPKVGHFYSANVDAIMAEAIAFVLEGEAAPAPP